jgi:hypothetical protein
MKEAIRIDMSHEKMRCEFFKLEKPPIGGLGGISKYTPVHMALSFNRIVFIGLVFSSSNACA